jgi:DNA repair exonuclease SbcCD ATPase subunit
MYRKIASWAFLIIGTLFLVLSIVGIAAIWVYRVPATNQAVARLEQVDSELTQAQTALDNGQAELQRTLRIVEAAEKSLASLKAQLSESKTLTDQVNGTLNGKVIPGLEATRAKIDQLRGTLQSLRESLKKLNSVPFLNLNLPGDQFLADLISGVDSLDKEIAAVVQLTQKASTFAGDASYLMGGNLTETKQRVQNLLNTINQYDEKVKVWHTQVRYLIDSTPRWINEAAVGLTLFLLWFGISQFGLILHGLALRQGADILTPLKRLERHEAEEYVD